MAKCFGLFVWKQFKRVRMCLERVYPEYEGVQPLGILRSGSGGITSCYYRMGAGITHDCLHLTSNILHLTSYILQDGIWRLVACPGGGQDQNPLARNFVRSL